MRPRPQNRDRSGLAKEIAMVQRRTLCLMLTVFTALFLFAAAAPAQAQDQPTLPPDLKLFIGKFASEGNTVVFATEEDRGDLKLKSYSFRGTDITKQVGLVRNGSDVNISGTEPNGGPFRIINLKANAKMLIGDVEINGSVTQRNVRYWRE
jgi:hypothetical protein